MAASIVLEINGVDRNEYLAADSGHMEMDLNGRGTFHGVLEALKTGYKPVKGNTLVVYQDSIKRFSGVIWRVVEKAHPGTGTTSSPTVLALQFTIDARDLYYILDKRRMGSVQYSGGISLYSLVEAINRSALSGEGISLANVPNPGPTVGEPLRFYYEPVSYALKRITDITAFQHRLDADKVLEFSQYTSNPAPFGLTESSGNWYDLEIESSDEDYRNRQHVRTESSGTRIIEETETLSDDAIFGGPFMIVDAAIQSVIEITLNGTPKTVMVVDSTETGFTNPTSGADFFVFLNDFGINALETVPLQNDVVFIRYRGIYSQAVVTVNDGSEQAARATLEGGSGIWEAIEEARNVGSPNTLLAIGSARLRQYGSDARRIRFSTDEPDLEVGQRININLAIHGINDDFLIERIEQEWVATGDEAQDFFRHRVHCTSIEPFNIQQPSGVLERLIEQSRIGPPDGEAGGEDQINAAYKVAFWHVAGDVELGDNGTNHVEVLQDGFVFEVWLSTEDGQPVSDCEVMITYSDPAGNPAVDVLNENAVLPAGEQRNDEDAVVFPSPQVFLEARGFLDLDVRVTGGVSNLVVNVKYR